MPHGLAEATSTAPQKIGEVQINDLVIEKYLLTSEEGIVVPTRIIFPKNHPSKLPAVLYLRDRNGENDSPSLFEELARQGRMVAVADVRGFGETMSASHIPDPHLDYFDPRDGMDADFTIASFFLGRPLLGMRVRDARAVVSFLHSRPEVDPAHLTIAGKGWAGVIALFAAAVDRQITSAAVEEIPASFGEIAAAHLYNQPLSLMLPGVLQDFDLPDVLASISPRPVLVLNPEDAMTRKMDLEQARQAGEIIRKSFAGTGAASRLEIKIAPIDSDARETLVKWISTQ